MQSLTRGWCSKAVITYHVQDQTQDRQVKAPVIYTVIVPSTGKALDLLR